MTFTPFDVAAAPLESGITQLEASAGTGKTYTLAGLFLRLVAEEGLEVGAILVTTFTIPATAELRDRIRDLLRDAVTMFDEGPGTHPLLVALHPRYVAHAEEFRPRLVRALQRFDDALIVTIHGFCTRLLQERAFETGLPFDAETLEDESALLREVADDFWRLRIYPAELRIGAFAMLAKLDAAALAKLLRACVQRPTMDILPAHDPAELAAAEADLRATFAQVEEAWTAGETDVRAIIDDAARWAKGTMKKQDVTSAAMASLARCFREPASCCADYAVLDFFTAESVAEQTTVRGKNPPQPPRHAFFDACSEFVLARARWTLAFQREFLDWAPAELARRKAQRNVLSFGDLLTRLRDALHGPRSAELIAATQQRFAVALVDEFQDTDPVQAEIFQQLFRDHGRLYLVGDPKQAIYSFRGADVFSYLDAASRAAHRHDLSANQRSVTPLVDAVNAIFERNPDAFVVPGIGFHRAAAAGRHDADALQCAGAGLAPFHFWVWSGAKPIAAGGAREHLATVVADGIVEQLQSGATSGTRALSPSDYAVLTVTNDEADLVRDALIAAGLPAVVLSRARVLESSEAAEMLALLQALATPTFEPAVRAALATTALGFTAADLATLPDARWEQLLETFLRRHLRWQADGFFPAFRALLVEEGVRPRLLSLPDGERRLTNLLHLAELLHHAASAQRLGPAALVRWLAMQMHADAESGEEQELRLESDEEAVKVVTIHKSKGLEFGVVWCPFSWRSAEPRAAAETTFHDPTSHRLVLDLGSPDYDAHRALMAQEQLAEQARLLYVALTRAKWQCHFVWGRFNKCENSAASWVLHPPGGAAESAVTTLQARDVTDETLRADLAALAAEVPGAFAIADVPAAVGRRYVAPAPAHPPRQARAFRGEIRRDFAIGSFSSLIANAAPEERDYDRQTATTAPVAAATGIHAFPRGRRAGTCLHEIFENLDFTQPATVEPLVQRKLEFFGFGRADLRAAVEANVRATLAAELEPGLRLVDVPNSARLNELEFHLPVERLDPAALERVLGEALPFTALSGFLKGFIDLVFEHDGKFFIADWKSNWLGPTVDDYTADAVAAEMRRHHYGVQYHLYCVALHRYLARRIADYDHATHFGGVFYIFLRGIDPARPELGIFRDRPSVERLTALDALLS